MDLGMAGGELWEFTSLISELRIVVASSWLLISIPQCAMRKFPQYLGYSRRIKKKGILAHTAEHLMWRKSLPYGSNTLKWNKSQLTMDMQHLNFPYAIWSNQCVPVVWGNHSERLKTGLDNCLKVGFFASGKKRVNEFRGRWICMHNLLDCQQMELGEVEDR